MKQAILKAIEQAKAYFGLDYEHYEVWKTTKTEVTIRAWTTNGEAYEFFTEPL